MDRSTPEEEYDEVGKDDADNGVEMENAVSEGTDHREKTRSID